MKQIWIPRLGGPEVLEIREAPDPAPEAGEVTIRVAYAGVNFGDVMARIGLYPGAPKLPLVVGFEVSGTIEAVGAGVTGLRAGQRVLALTRLGGYSSVVRAKAALVLPLPDSLGLEKAAALPVAYLTAWTMLVRLGNLQPGDKVLVHAAAGGVGLAAVQIARWRGAEIFGTASTSKLGRLKEAGVAHAIDYTSQDFEREVMRTTEGQGVDLVLDAIGGDSFKKSYRCLAPLGRLYVYGASAFAPGAGRDLLPILQQLCALPKWKPLELMKENRGVHGVDLDHLWDRADQLGDMLRPILALTESRALDPVVDRIFPFAEAGAAHDHLKERKNFGKVLLRP
jgi:NADPH:quinone reductase-like Zn-dependent oxidoreductase